MNEAMHVRDILIGIGYYMPQGRKGFRHLTRKFHEFFYQSKKSFPVLGGLMFDTNGQYPISEELDEAVSSLILSGMLVSSTNSGYYQFHPAVNSSYQEIFKRINRHQARDLVQIAQEFDQEFGEANRFVLG